MHKPDVAVGLQFTTMGDDLPSYRVRVPNWTKDLNKAVRFLEQQECGHTIGFDQQGVIRRATGVLLAQMMAKQGINVTLMRDMTDTMYNPKMAPFVSHFTGTDLVVEHIEIRNHLGVGDAWQINFPWINTCRQYDIVIPRKVFGDNAGVQL